MQMGDTEKYKPQLVMYRPNLAELPAVQLPEGYSCRTYQPGDEAAWESIIFQSFQWKSDFRKQMEEDEYYNLGKIFFICYGDTPIATASAWHRPAWGRHVGYLHMVGVIPGHGGKGLGLQVSLAALHHMANTGKEASILETDDFRIPAIKTYLRLGYKPLLIHENQAERWKDLITANDLRIND
jgi:mycothiol synthase